MKSGKGGSAPSLPGAKPVTGKAGGMKTTPSVSPVRPARLLHLETQNGLVRGKWLAFPIRFGVRDLGRLLLRAAAGSPSWTAASLDVTQSGIRVPNRVRASVNWCVQIADSPFANCL